MRFIYLLTIIILPVVASMILPGSDVNFSQPSTVTPSDDRAIRFGDVSFTPRSFTVTAASVSAGDFNNDGYLDLVNAGEPELTILLGDGTGVVTPFSQVEGGEQPDEFALADLNEDGNLDIVVANHDTDHVTLLLGDGNGTFAPADGSPIRVDVQPHPHVVRSLDVDGDGHLDLMVDNRDAEGVLVLRGNGDGTFDMPGTQIDVGGDPYRGMAVGDINGNGKLDLVTPNPSEVGVLLNMSKDGRIAFDQLSPIPAEAPFAVELGDFNGDGRLDLIATSDEGSALVQIYLGDGTGKFTEAENSPFELAPGGKRIVIGDFNGDGLDDAAISSYQFLEVMVLLGETDSLQTGFLPGDEHPWGMAAADFNGDGRDDLVIADDVTHDATIYLSVAP